jgi:hypothetical protein
MSPRALLAARILIAAALLFSPARVIGQSSLLVEEPLGVPMRVRDYTFPTFLVLDFAPAPAAPLGRGRIAVELHSSRVNNFQVSGMVEEYLRTSRGGLRRPLDQTDVEYILGLPDGEGYYIDGEFSFQELGVHFGITDRLDVGVNLYYLDFGGGYLDNSIFDFHDALSYGQQGRDLAANDTFQIVFGENGEGVVDIDGPPAGGMSDPTFFLRYAIPSDFHGWRFNVGMGVKPSVAKEPLSSGSADYGVVLAADRRWKRNAFIANISAVDSGPFSTLSLDPPLIPSIDLVWLHQFARWPHTRLFVQGLVAEHVLSEVTNSELGDVEVQLTFGTKWQTRAGVFGFGLTENLFNFDNTPDIGVHMSWGFLTR